VEDPLVKGEGFCSASSFDVVTACAKIQVQFETPKLQLFKKKRTDCGNKPEDIIFLIGAIPLCCNNIMIFYYRLNTHLKIFSSS
jgi:hypothetical protein